MSRGSPNHRIPPTRQNNYYLFSARELAHHLRAGCSSEALNPHDRIVVVVSIFQLRKLRLKDLIRVTQIKGYGAKAQTLGISPHSVLFSASCWGRAGINCSDRDKGQKRHQASLRLAHLVLI